MTREQQDQADIIEMATTYAMAVVMRPGFAEKRDAMRRKERPTPLSGGANLAEWQRMAREGRAGIVMTSDPDAPVH